MNTSKRSSKCVLCRQLYGYRLSTGIPLGWTMLHVYAWVVIRRPVPPVGAV